MTATTRTRNDEANCIGINPAFFEHEEFYDIGLEACSTCNVRLWCLQLVDPANNWSDGVIGGHAWQNGRPIESATTATDPILRTYLKAQDHKVDILNRRDIKKPKREPDELAIEAFIEGQIYWRKLSAEERKIAALRMWETGQYTQTDISDLTKLSGHTLKKVLPL